MKYKNIKTGVTIETESKISGKNWVEYGDQEDTDPEDGDQEDTDPEDGDQEDEKKETEKKKTGRKKAGTN